MVFIVTDIEKGQIFVLHDFTSTVKRRNVFLYEFAYFRTEISGK